METEIEIHTISPSPPLPCSSAPLLLIPKPPMSTITLKPNAFILYKNKPGLVNSIGSKKISISVQGVGTVSVRPKDVTILHPGPLKSVDALRPPDGDPLIAWELLEGEVSSIRELAELAYDAYTPATVWAIWTMIVDGLYFSGTADVVQVHTAEKVSAISEALATKAAEKELWEGYLRRMGRGEFLMKEDGRFLQDVIALANGQTGKSRTLHGLKQTESPENAHALLLKIGYWDEMVNPHPLRAGVAIKSPTLPLPELPDEDRRDLTHLTAYAIDDAGSTDPDDALSWEDGRLWVHIADVAAIIMPDDPVDVEARGRGANLYLPEGTVNMLPHEATARLALGLTDTSPALSFCIELTDDSGIESVEIMPSWVRVTRLSYAQVEDRLDEPILRELYAIAQKYEARRDEAGAIKIELPEVRVRVVDGVVDIRPLPALRSRALVREAMLITGEAVARFALEHDIPIPFTSQPPPLEELEEASTLADYFGRRRKMQPSRPSIQPGGHAGLGMGLYTQATSPLRRYVDMVVHQQLRTWLLGGEPMDDRALMERVGAAGAITGDVRYAERQSNRHWKMVYLQQNPEWAGDGIVVEQRGKQNIVLIPSLAMDTRVREQGGKRPLNTSLPLTIKHVDLVQLEAKFSTG